MTPDPWGIEDGYWDIRGQWHETTDAMRRQLRMAMGGLGDVDDPPPQTRPVWFVREGSAPAIQRPARLVLEDGTEVDAADSLPADLPLGYHELHPNDGGPTTRLVVAPDRCHGRDGRGWAWSAQLYAARSSRSWGIGDLDDLRRLVEWSGELGARYVAVNPLHATKPLPEQEPSPYFPSSRLYRNPLYLCIESVPGYDPEDAVLAEAAAAGRAMNEARTIFRRHVHSLKLAALERLWAVFDRDPRFDAYVAEQGAALRRYATYCALAERHDGGWTSWPSEHRRVDSAGVERFAAEHAHRVQFHSWVQWLLDEQLAAVGGAGTAVLGDLAIGVDADGADAWVWRDAMAPGVRIGAPPDEFNIAGQDWGLPPFVPWRLRALGYAPFVQVIRAAMRHCGALRIDHVMGLFRLYWIPEGCTAEEGSYVRFPGTELLDIVALESARAGVEVVGEDLGTVEDEVRADLASRGVLSYRVAWFEPEPPEHYPVDALAAITTHDLPTIAGVWTEHDLDDQRRAGVSPNVDGHETQRARLRELTGLDGDAPVEDVVRAAYRRLARAPSRLVAATLDDALGVAERPNIPGTTAERPNWSLALPLPLEDVFAAEDVREVASCLQRRDED